MEGASVLLGVATVRLKTSRPTQNVERALLEAGKYESAEAAWKSVYEITTYHIGGVANAYECNFEVRSSPTPTPVTGAGCHGCQ